MSEAISIINSLPKIKKPFLILAREQYKGIGREYNTWYSPEGGLWFTYVITNECVQSNITLVIGYLILNMLSIHFPNLKNHLKIKWPNDILLNDKKVCGILTKCIQDYLVIGVGINTNVYSFPEHLLSIAISLSEIMNCTISNKGLLLSFFHNFISAYETYKNNGFSYFKKDIENNLYRLNEKIVISTSDSIYEGYCLGLSDIGAIKIKLKNNIVKEIISGSFISKSS